MIKHMTLPDLSSIPLLCCEDVIHNHLQVQDGPLPAIDGVPWPRQMVRNRWVTGVIHVITSLMKVTTPSITGRAHLVDLRRNE